MSAQPTPAQSAGWLSRAGSFLVGVFTRNLPAKLAALVLALLVWFTVRQDITATHTADQCRVISKLPQGLIWIDTPPDYVKVKFSGPRSRMSDIIKDPEGTRISLMVRESDLVGQPRALLRFSVENGKIRHVYGSDVAIESVDGAPFELWVAALEQKTVRVQVPVVTEVQDDWTVEVDILPSEVTVSGPRASLNTLDVLIPEPIDVSYLFRGITDPKPIALVRRPLTLPRSFKDAHLSLPEGMTIYCEMVFPLAPKRENLVVPIEVHRVGSSELTMEFKEDDQVTKVNGGHRIQLTFKGTRSDLSALRAAIERDTVTAYVRTTDSKRLQSGRTGSDFIDTANLKMEGLPSGIKFEPPAHEIDVEVR